MKRTLQVLTMGIPLYATGLAASLMGTTPGGAPRPPASSAPLTRGSTTGPVTRGAPGSVTRPTPRPAASASAPASLPGNPPPITAGTDLPATSVTLAASSMPAKDALAELVRQLKLPEATFASDAAGWGAVKLEAKNQPFWSVLPAIDDQIQHQVTIGADGKIMASANRGYMGYGARCASGPFLVVLAAIDHGVALPGAPSSSITSSIQANIYAEPQLQVLAMDTTNCPDVAVDELGHSLKPAAFTKARSQAFQSSSPGPQAFFIRLQPDDQVGHQIAELRGKVSVWIGKDPQSVTIDASIRDVSTPMFGGTTLRVRPLRSTGTKTFQVEISIERTSSGLSSDTLYSVINTQVLDASDKPLYVRSGRTMSGYLNDVTQVDPAGKADRDAPAKLVITMPSVFQEVAVPYSYKNLTYP